MALRKKTTRLLAVTALVFLAALPVAAHAAAPWSDYFPLVRCGTAANPEPCTPCGLFETVYHVINFILFGVTGPVATAVIVFAGGMFLVGADNPALRNRAKKMLTQTILGVTVILLAWAATNFLIHTLGPQDNSAWYDFTCPVFLQNAVELPTLPQANASTGQAGRPNAQLVQALTDSCKEQSLATAYKTASTAKDSSALTQMMSCLERDSIVKKLIQGSKKFTIDQTHPLCNYDRGNRVCSICSHGRYSCHYGGATGKDGAEAVDYNWGGSTVTYKAGTRSVLSGDCPTNTVCVTVKSEEGLFRELYIANQKNSCKAKFINFEGDHTHVSTSACDKDGTGAKGAALPSI
jgi:hypothetical protein